VVGCAVAGVVWSVGAVAGAVVVWSVGCVGAV